MSKKIYVRKIYEKLTKSGLLVELKSDYHIKIGEHNFYPTTGKYTNDKTDASFKINLDMMMEDKEFFDKFLKENSVHYQSIRNDILDNEKVCIGCGRLKKDPWTTNHLSCCPNNHYIPLKELLEKYKFEKVLK